MIYAHIPFCHGKCFYCDFYSTPDLRRMEAVTERIILEYSLRANELGEETGPNTLYFGGGTPSILPAHLFVRLAQALYHPGKTEEFTIEINPEDVTSRAVELWRSQGVNRASMGIQSFVDSELKAAGRRHSAADASEAIRMLREGGITNLSCDLIYGLPGQTASSWNYSLDRLIAEQPDHISAYCLSYEPGTVLTRRLKEGRIEAATDELIEEMYATVCHRLRAEGFEHYEISNFARPGRRSLHNSSYWTGVPYLGLGPGAHSLDRHGVRRINPPDVRLYTSSKHFPVSEIDPETATDRLNDTLITALRTSGGLATGTIGQEESSILLSKAAPYINRGQMTLDDEGRLAITESAWLLSDAILRDLLF